MSKLIKVVAVFFDDEPKYKGINSGLVLELEDGRLMRHSQDGYVVPFEELDPSDNGLTQPPSKEEPEDE